MFLNPEMLNFFIHYILASGSFVTNYCWEWTGMEMISLRHCWGVIEAQLALMEDFGSSLFLGRVFFIFLPIYWTLPVNYWPVLFVYMRIYLKAIAHRALSMAKTVRLHITLTLRGVKWQLLFHRHFFTHICCMLGK